MRAIKVPDEYDMNICMKKESLKEAKSCPWCSSTDVKCDENPTVIKVKNGLFKKTNMLEFKCVCKSCGGVYATKPYPIEAERSKSINEIPISNSKTCIAFLLFIASVMVSIFATWIDDIHTRFFINGMEIHDQVIYAASFGFSVGVALSLVLFLICDSYEETQK